MSLGFSEVLCSAAGDGTALTAAARASLTQGITAARWALQPNTLRNGDVLEGYAAGRISCAVTTPGTARFDLSFGGTANFDTLAMPLNIVVQTNVMWELEFKGIVRILGNVAQIFWSGHWISPASINTAAPATGPGPGGQMVPYNTAPVIGPAFDHTVVQAVDLQFTQTVATGSITLHNFFLKKSSTGF